MNILNWFFNLFSEKDPYPKTVEEVLDDKIKYRAGVEEIMLWFRELKPWRGDMKPKLLALNNSLSKLYKVHPQIVFVKKFVYGSCYFPVGNLIVLEEEKDGRYSVVTYLHEFGHALGKNEKETCRWSINLFRKYFPKSYERLVPNGHLLCMKDDNENFSASR